jgi:PAS domain S-box-containing protein
MKAGSESRTHSALPGELRERASQGRPYPESEWQDLVYELAPLAYLNFDTCGRILDFNVAASRLLGVSRKRDLHRPLSDFVAPRHHRRLLKHVRQSQASRIPVVTSIRLRAQNEGSIPTDIEMSTRPASEAPSYRTQLLPISGAGPVAWPDGDAKFRALVENSSEVICIGAPDGTIFYTTPSVRRVLGYEPASWFGRNAFEVMPPAQAELVRASVRQLAVGPTGAVLRVVTQVRHFDGSWKWVEAVLTNLIGQPAIGGIVCNYRDISASRAAEEALRTSEQRLRHSEEALIQANNALDQRVRERTAELHEANRELSAEIAERTRLEREIIRISEREQRRIGQDLHDGLCQELTAITLITRALSTRMGRRGAAETQRVNDVAHLLNDSISRCRDIARGLHPVEMDADGLMVALNDLATRTRKSVACSFQCKEPILMPESDMALNLYRIAQEAVNNAVKYSGATRIIISLGRDGAALRLSIADDGRGIPASSTRPRAKQLGGMGLHIMRYRARTMGATLRIQDRQPHGAEVLCLLPRK